MYHQHEPNFRMICDLHPTCGVLYRTYAAYKSHIYRRHSSELHSSERCNSDPDVTLSDEGEHSSEDADDEFGSTNDVVENLLDSDVDQEDSIAITNDPAAAFPMLPFSIHSMNGGESIVETMESIKRNYVSFILQLREEFLLPKSVTSIISTHIITLVRNIEMLSKKTTLSDRSNDHSSASADTEKQNRKVIEFDRLKQTLDEVCETIDTITKNEYQFTKHCTQYFDYDPPEEIVVSSANEPVECGYFIPIEKTLSVMLNSRDVLAQILDNMRQQRAATEYDDDLMFSIRDAYHGGKLDHESLLIQLYLDDIGLTNPIGAKRDQHKMTMVYFTLEDVPDQYRSRLDFVHLVGICDSRVLKVNYQNNTSDRMTPVDRQSVPFRVE
jgi:hypothetical protein